VSVAQAARDLGLHANLLREGQNSKPDAALKATLVVSSGNAGKDRRLQEILGRCRLHGGASGSGGPPGERNGQYRHGERTKIAIAERQKFSALLKMLRAGLT
jgi:hypothetical protein